MKKIISSCSMILFLVILTYSSYALVAYHSADQIEGNIDGRMTGGFYVSDKTNTCNASTGIFTNCNDIIYLNLNPYSIVSFKPIYSLENIIVVKNVTANVNIEAWQDVISHDDLISYDDLIVQNNAYIYGTLNSLIINTNKLCIDSECKEKLIPKANVDTNGEWVWTRVFENHYDGGPGNPSVLYSYVYLDPIRPVLGIKISGYTDDGGICTAGVDYYFYGGITNIAFIDDLDIDGSLHARAWSYGAGPMLATSWIFENVHAGRNLGGQSYNNNRAHNKAAGVTYIPAGKKLEIRQWYYDGQGEHYNNCYVDILYGT